MSGLARTVRRHEIFGWLLLVAAGGLSSAHALDANSRDPQAIMRAAYAPARLDRVFSRMRMTIHEGSSSRTRVLDMRTKRFEQGRKTLLLLEEPADIRNTGFLSIDYTAKDKADEQWLYLPHLHRVSRVPASGKADAFVGSDFSYADLGTVDPNDYDSKVVDASANVDGEACWLIESVPRSDAVKEASGYSKFQTWIAKRTDVPLQSKLWTRTPERIKYLKVTDVRNVDGAWIPFRYQMRTLEKGALVSETVIDVLTVTPNSPDVTDDQFTQQRLARGV